VKLYALAALLAAPLMAAAADAADPATPVPAAGYRSVFDGIPQGVEEETVDWKKANAEVAQFPRGHIDLLKWEEANPGAAPRPQAAPTDGLSPRPAPPARGHQH
jgi:opacity protein-like surface antigen